MHRFSLLLALIFFHALAAPKISAQTPQINDGGMVNAASFAPSAPLAPGVIFSVFGTDLTDGARAGPRRTPVCQPMILLGHQRFEPSPSIRSTLPPPMW